MIRNSLLRKKMTHIKVKSVNTFSPLGARIWAEGDFIVLDQRYQWMIPYHAVTTKSQALKRNFWKYRLHVEHPIWQFASNQMKCRVYDFYMLIQHALYQNFFSGSLQQSSLLQKISKYCNFGAKFFAIMMIIATNDWKSFDIMVVI